MKKISNRNVIMHITAMVMIACMMIADVSMFSIYRSSYKMLSYVEEEHLLDYAGADGDFGGTGSSGKEFEESDISVGSSKQQFNILEIVPHESMGVMGYFVEGLEPVGGVAEVKIGSEVVATEAEMRYAIMDALVNRVPGSNDANSQNVYMNKDVWMLSDKSREGGVHDAFNFEAWQTYSGYYKYVGHNKGVYAIAQRSNGDYEIDRANKQAIMVSKFYSSEYKNTGNFDYIWVYGEDSEDNVTPGDYKYIYVNNHKKIKYSNNDKFLLDMYGLSSSEIAGWKNDHKISVITKAPKDVTMQNIEWADVITVNSGQNMDYYNNAVSIYNKTHGTNHNRGSFNFSSDNDFKDEGDYTGFEKAIRIYERVAVREDAAIIACKNSVPNPVFDTNLRKLLCMLYFVYDNNAGDDPNRVGSGRRMFMDYMKRYVDEPGSFKTYDPADGHEKSYYDIRQSDSRFIAPGLGGPDNNGYMHQTHPLVRTNDEAIWESYFDNNSHNLVAVKGVPEVKNRRTAKRNDRDMYYSEGDRLGLDQNASYSQKENYGESVKEFYYSPLDYDRYGNIIPFGVTDIIPWSASDQERREMTEYKDDYKNYRWRMPLYESKSSTTDYVYLDRNGNFVRDDKYSGAWYGIDALENRGNVWEYKIVKWDRMDQNTWPWNVVEGSCLREWWFGEGSTQVPGNSRGKHIHLYYDYYAYGSYRAVNNPGFGNYKNQSFTEENGMFKNDNIKKAVRNRPVWREDDDPNHVVEVDDTDSVYYYIAMNIVNGDGVNKTSSDVKNKVLYVNDYEMNEGSTPYIPITFEIETSANIEKIELFNSAGTVIKTYTPKAGNDITSASAPLRFSISGGAGELKLVKKEYKDENGDPIYTGPPEAGQVVYKFSGTIKDLVFANYSTGINNKFQLRVTAKPVADKPSVSVTDTITIVKRTFFELN